MDDELREALLKDYKFYFDMAEKAQKGPAARQLRILMAAMKLIMGK